MANRTVTKQQIPTSKVSTTNAEGNEKTDNSSSTIADLQTYSVADTNLKVAGLANGYAQATRTK